MVEGTSHMFISGPRVIREETGEVTDFEGLGGADAHGTRSGACHFTANSEQDCFRQIRELLGYLPQNCGEAAGHKPTEDDPKRESALLDKIAHLDPHTPYSMHDVIREIADEGRFLEVHRAFAMNIVCGFIRLAGASVGVVGNNPRVRSGALDGAASEKAARFVRFCDAFGIPVLSLVDVPGYWPGVEEEHNGIIRRGAKLVYAYCQATVPKVTVVLKKAYGGGYDVMGSKHVRGDMNFAWPCAEIAVTGPHAAVDMLHGREIKAAADPEARREELTAEYIKRLANPYLAAQRGYIDEVVEGKVTRQKVIRALEFLKNKRLDRTPKKHGNIPL